jgi:hypothetical protein
VRRDFGLSRDKSRKKVFGYKKKKCEVGVKVNLFMKVQTQLFSSKIFSEFDAVLVAENDNNYIYSEPLPYLWSVRLKERFGLETDIFPLKKIEKSMVQVGGSLKTMCYDEWIFDYPISSQNLIDCACVFRFFESFAKHSDEPLAVRLKNTILDTEKYMPFYQMQELVTFVCDKNVKDADRLRLLFCDVINKYALRKQ